MSGAPTRQEVEDAILAKGVRLPSEVGTNRDAALLALRPQWLVTRAALHRFFNHCLFVPEFSDPDFTKKMQELQAIRDARAKAGGFDEFERREVDAPEADRAMVASIAEQPALTLAGIRFKVEVSFAHDHCHDVVVASIMNDLLVLTGGDL